MATAPMGTKPNGRGPASQDLFADCMPAINPDLDKQFLNNWLPAALDTGEYERVRQLPLTILRDMYAIVYETGPEALYWLADMQLIRRALLGFEGRDSEANDWVQDRFCLYSQAPRLTADERHEANGSMRLISGSAWAKLAAIPTEIRAMNDPDTLQDVYGVTIFPFDLSAKIEWFSYVYLMLDIMRRWDKPGYQARYAALLEGHAKLVVDLRELAARYPL